MASSESLCTCGQPYDNTKFMIQCDICKDWLHGLCVGLREHQSVDIDKYHCPRCELMCGPSIYKQRTNWHRLDPYEANAESRPVQTGTPIFIKELRSRHFEGADDVVVRLRGQQLTLPYLAQHGWERPIQLDSVEGLGMQLPPAAGFTVHDIENYVGSEREVDVIDVGRQRDIRLTMHELADYFSSGQRSETLNCISLEFSGTGLSALVEAPYIVRKLCWVTSLWPTPPPEGVEKPTVTKYALISAVDSYTDFHVDFGGTSVWYHVLQGEKIFYLIRPTASNLTLYQRWLNSPTRSSTFFGDQVDACSRLCVRAGQTLLIPSGWIHAVYTPHDSLVFGGNFLCSLNVPIQLKVYELEKKSRTPLKFRFPSFETCHWLGARRLVEEMRDYSDANQRCPTYLVQAGRSLAAQLRAWAHDASSARRGVEPIPAFINPSKLIKMINKEVRHAEKYSAHAPAVAPARPERQSRRQVKKRPLGADFVDISERSEFESLLQQSAAAERRTEPARRLTVPRPVPSPAPGPASGAHRAPPAAGGGLKIRLGPRVQPPPGLDDDDEEAPLTIDDSAPASRRYGRIRSVSMDNPLKLRLSIDGRADPAPPPASNGIEELLRASSVADGGGGGGGGSDGTLPAGQASPATRDAIVGMLTMSRAVVEPEPAPAPAAKRSRPHSYSSDEETFAATQDDEYVYPAIDDSDDEHVFKPRGRRRGDEAWNPKARVSVNAGRSWRPARPNAARRPPLTPQSAGHRTLASLKKVQPKKRDPQPGSSSSGLSLGGGPDSVKRPKPKKGMATAKQRLGKILKLNKMKF
ncbi:lysine-specific demethylase 7B-like isoform X2 [Amphibalanus amphitrite]|nr:lysine-specific demethylase 7B-like isoform X2 [Amphibalanus amphitrite]XP_043216779.1 lysine-specific demethylase 7B-like isoform X2 [Amphibalanus amphitrite]